MFSKLFNVRDLDGLLALYEPEGVLGRYDGGLATGYEAIRGELVALFDRGITVTIGERRSTVRLGRALALLSHAVDLTGPEGTSTVTSTEVVRRQPDGRWLYAIDAPFFAAPARGSAS